MGQSAVDAVENLQRYDDNLDAVAKKRLGLTGRLAALAAERAAHAGRIAGLNARIAAADKAGRGLGREIEAKEADIAKFGSRYLLLQTEKEVEKYNVEMERLRSEKDALEESLLGQMEIVETVTAELAEAERAGAADELGRGVEEEKLGDEIANLDEEKAKLTRLRSDYAAGMVPEPLAVYEAVRGKLRPAVARVERGNCGGCHLQISANALSELRDRGQLRKCGQCGRILYLPPR